MTLSRSTVLVWKVRGEIKKADAPGGYFKADSRTVYLAWPEFPSVETATAALLHNWSRSPHEARVLAVVPHVTDGQQVDVIVPTQEDDDA